MYNSYNMKSQLHTMATPVMDSRRNQQQATTKSDSKLFKSVDSINTTDQIGEISSQEALENEHEPEVDIMTIPMKFHQEKDIKPSATALEGYSGRNSFSIFDVQKSRPSSRMSVDLIGVRGDGAPVETKPTFRMPRSSFLKTQSRSVSRGSLFGGSKSSPSFMSSPSIANDVRETNKMNKEYDAKTGNKMVNQYMILEELGRGMYGKVKLAMDIDTNEYFALKIVQKKNKKKFGGKNFMQKADRNASDNYVLDKIKREVAIMKKCDHPHVVKLREVIDDPSSVKMYLILEYLEGGHVKWQNPEHPDQPLLHVSTCRQIFRDIVAGVQYLHYQGIVHRDIKPANLLWDSEGKIKISDFGVSVFVKKLQSKDYNAGGDSPLHNTFTLPNSNHSHTFVSTESLHISPNNDDEDDESELVKTAGSPAFFAPELCSIGDDILPDNRPVTLGQAIDIWAMGVTLYCLVFGRVPFIAETEFELFRTICSHKLSIPHSASPELCDLLLKLLDKNPETRITLDEIKVHPWTTMDMSDKDRKQWIIETDPSLQSWRKLEVTDEEIVSAFNIIGRLRKTFRKLSNSFLNLASSLTSKRKSFSVSRLQGHQQSDLLYSNHVSASRQVSNSSNFSLVEPSSTKNNNNHEFNDSKSSLNLSSADNYNTRVEFNSINQYSNQDVTETTKLDTNHHINNAFSSEYPEIDQVALEKQRIQQWNSMYE